MYQDIEAWLGGKLTMAPTHNIQVPYPHPERETHGEARHCEVFRNPGRTGASTQTETDPDWGPTAIGHSRMTMLGQRKSPAEQKVPEGLDRKSVV